MQAWHRFHKTARRTSGKVVNRFIFLGAGGGVLYAISETLTSGAFGPQSKGFTQLSRGALGHRSKTLNTHILPEENSV